MIQRALVVTVLGACTATTVSPPLSASVATSEPQRTFGTVQLTSGEFKKPHRVIGVIQMTQTGYKWFHEVEVIEDANPGSLLFEIGSYAREHAADGVQHLTLVDLDPQTPADKAGKQIDSAVRIAKNIERGNPAAIAGEGTKTRWEIRGELVQFDKGAP